MRTKEDIAKYKKEWRAKNRHKCAQYSRSWIAKNPEYKKEWNTRNPERYRKYSTTWRLKHLDQSRLRVRNWEAANPEKKKAHKKVLAATKSGLLTRLPCVKCGDIKSHAHHDDYSKPLDVIWLCARHHKARHT